MLPTTHVNHYDGTQNNNVGHESYLTILSLFLLLSFSLSLFSTFSLSLSLSFLLSLSGHSQKEVRRNEHSLSLRVHRTHHHLHMCETPGSVVQDGSNTVRSTPKKRDSETSDCLKLPCVGHRSLHQHHNPCDQKRAQPVMWLWLLCV